MEQGQGQQKNLRNLRSSYNDTSGRHFLMCFACFLLSLTVIFMPAAQCYRLRKNAELTTIVGVPLKFTGKASSLFGLFIKWLFLSIFTLTIYMWVCVPVKYKQWVAENTIFGPIG